MNKHEAKKYQFDAMRLRKREDLLKAGVSAYPYDYQPEPPLEKIGDVLNRVAEIEDGDESGKPLEDNPPVVSLAGRIWSKRKMGKAAFWDLTDDTGKIQLYLKRDELPAEDWGLMQHLDLADIIGVTGKLFRTQTGELSVGLTRLQVLSKAVVNVPIGKETEEGVKYRITDVETKYRERYLHWMLDPEDRERIRLRSRITSLIRDWMETEGFLEVQTPTIENVYGGAEARPFETEIWALDHQKAFLRISPELYLKRYIVAGFDKVFTICQNFRNEGIDHSHNPEFTMMEWYEAFTDYERQMERFESLISHVCEQLHGTTKIEFQGEILDFSTPWPRLSVLEALQEFAGIDAGGMNVEDLIAEFNKREIALPAPREQLTWGLAVAELFEELCEEHLVQPTFIKDLPVEISPLTKRKRGDDRLVERFEPYAAKMEIGNAYSELTDPVDQLERFLAQRSRPDEPKPLDQKMHRPDDKEKDDQYEDHPIDADFVKAIGVGMPPTGGVGVGIDRIIMLMTDTAGIRDIIGFPMVKPKRD